MAKGRKIVKTRKNKFKKRINMKGGNKTRKKRAEEKRKQHEFHKEVINKSRRADLNYKNEQGNNSPSKPGQNKNGSNKNSSINETNNNRTINEPNNNSSINETNNNRTNNAPSMQPLGPGPRRGPPGSAVTGLAGVVAAVGLFSLVYISSNK